ncbi:hypothetical protein L2E82_43866 [Cichorium intybus]|uniref:Uncharacterized protein n=1 Tax=Cichorium intybus TaxID=13427 RepID=A0ACB8ZND3_CICIN|nr:hypothetical protein L2E82_43866 [Cichorium intybus]
MMKSFSLFSSRTKRRGKSSPKLREKNSSVKLPLRLVKSTCSIASSRSIPELYREKAHNLMKFSFSELRNATNNFNRMVKINDGGFESVYKGSIKPPDGCSQRDGSFTGHRVYQKVQNAGSVIVGKIL